jgi:hypothetical protein
VSEEVNISMHFHPDPTTGVISDFTLWVQN